MSPTLALTALRDAGLVNDRHTLNRAWLELLGRFTATSGQRCQQPGCDDLGVPFLEPAGTWCATHRPTLWRTPDRDWATPRCRCGRPGSRPDRHGAPTAPVCREHAPRWMRSYLLDPTIEGVTA